MAAEKGRTMGNAVGCPTEWAEEMEESSFFLDVLTSLDFKLFVSESVSKSCFFIYSNIQLI